MVFGGLAQAVWAWTPKALEWTQTARYKDGSTDLLKSMPPLVFMPMPASQSMGGPVLSVDWSQEYQEILGFGGAFTEASAYNWRSLTADEQAEVIRLYFAAPSDGGHGYLLGRVPINSCDFSPTSYNFDNATCDVHDGKCTSKDEGLEHFDDSVAHDVESGMIPMIQAAQKLVKKRGLKLSLFASPWSPPPWMKLPVGGNRSMLLSASPNGLDPAMQRPWAKYFSRWISAYKKQGIDIWGVTVQNEPEAAVGWEACLWTPQFMAQFVKRHLGPVLREEQPGVKIIGFDHNKDHVLQWARVLFADAEASKYFDGIGVHWYGGLNTHNLNATHALAPDKFILPTEACNCGGVTFRDPDLVTWWSRAESIALDILEDLRYWAIGWTDWNLILNPWGGPNHLKNLCDANIIADPTQNRSAGRLIMQASYYFMGHFSRFIPQGSRRVALHNSVQTKLPPVSAGDVKDGQPLVFKPCDGNDVQQWKLDAQKALVVPGSNEAPTSDGYAHGGMCVDIASDVSPPKLQVWACAHSANQAWQTKEVSGGRELVSGATGKCLTKVTTSGAAVGLDAGTTVDAAQLGECGTPAAKLTLGNYDGGGFPSNFAVRSGDGLCLQPLVLRTQQFDAVAFKAPDGSVSLIALNTGEKPIEFALHDAQAGIGVPSITLPPHAIHSYRWSKTDDPKEELRLGAMQLRAEDVLPARPQPDGPQPDGPQHAADGREPRPDHPPPRSAQPSSVGEPSRRARPALGAGAGVATGALLLVGLLVAGARLRRGRWQPVRLADEARGDGGPYVAFEPAGRG